jgi:hypothetical protein
MQALLALMLFFSSQAIAEAKNQYVCTPQDLKTATYYGGILFSLTVDNQCINLVSLKEKDQYWTWKISIKNSFGDAEGSRHYCTRKDEGMLGNPAIWERNKKTFSTFELSRGLMTFKCEPKD